MAKVGYGDMHAPYNYNNITYAKIELPSTLVLMKPLTIPYHGQDLFLVLNHQHITLPQAI